MSARRVAVGLLWLSAVLVAGLLVLALVAPGAASSRSSLDRGPRGAAALRSVLVRLGHDVESLRLGLHVLSRKEVGVLFIASPPGLVAWPPLTAGDAERVMGWVDRGGVAVLVQDRPGPVLAMLGASVDPSGLPRSSAGSRPALPTQPAASTVGGPLALRGRATLTLVPEWTPLWSVRGAVVGARREWGAGEVLVVSDPDALSNSDLGRGGNLAFFVAIVSAALPDGGHVYFDDLHAGGGDAHGVVAYARRAGAGPALIVVALLLALGLWRGGAREAPAVRARPAPPVLGGAEHVRALAGLYARAGLRRHALEVTSRDFRRRVEARAGVAWELDRLDRWLKDELGPQAAVEFARVRAGFVRLFAAPEPDPAAVLAVARLAARFERRWLGARREGPKRTAVYAPSPQLEA